MRPPLWQEVGEVVDDLADHCDRKLNVGSSHVGWKIAEAWIEGRLSLHAHLRIAPFGREADARDLCLTFEPLCRWQVRADLRDSDILALADKSCSVVNSLGADAAVICRVRCLSKLLNHGTTPNDAASLLFVRLYGWFRSMIATASLLTYRST
jgi:hypothetical protein